MNQPQTIGEDTFSERGTQASKPRHGQRIKAVRTEVYSRL
jgi:hypothetical protein